MVRSFQTVSYTYDPLDKRPAELEREEIKDYFTDQTFDLNLFGNGLVYHSAAFSKAIEITGWVKFVAWMSLDVPDTDFCVSLSEVLPNGKVIKLTQDLLRARYRESLREEKLVVPGEINPYTFDGFIFFSRRVAKGSRLRLIINCPNTIYLEKITTVGEWLRMKQRRMRKRPILLSTTMQTIKVIWKFLLRDRGATERMNNYGHTPSGMWPLSFACSIVQLVTVSDRWCVAPLPRAAAGPDG